jgi:GDP-mannose transporter
MLFPLVLSCVVGVCMSHASYLLRDNVSATLFTVVGILCKIVTVIINFMIWDKHATLEGVAFLMLW